MSLKGNFIIWLLALVAGVQVYIMLFHDPVELSKKGLIESRILLQGHDPGVPQPVPGQDPEQEGEKVTVQTIGTGPRPVVPASHGEGQDEPMLPLSVRPKGPIVPGMPDDMKNAKFEMQGGQDYFKAIVYGVLILEEQGELALSKEQAVKLKKIIEMKADSGDAIPFAQQTIGETLTDEQLRYIYRQMCLKRGGLKPLPPESIETYSGQVYQMLKNKK
ncbi:MAG: hypothetical protein LWY06_12830 [Firmicutes bacterium]|nr:hypothetical protein [Bacillota bacterium]